MPFSVIYDKNLGVELVSSWAVGNSNCVSL